MEEILLHVTLLGSNCSGMFLLQMSPIWSTWARNIIRQ